MTFSDQIKRTILDVLPNIAVKGFMIFSIMVCVLETTSAQGCGDIVLDPGGNADYPNNANWIQTYTGGEGDIMEIVFTSFNTEASYDYLYVHDGPTTSSPLLATLTGDLSGASLPSNITASGNDITLRFTSDGSVVRPGFELEVQCLAPPCDDLYYFKWYDGTDGAIWPISNGETSITNVYPISGATDLYSVTVTMTNDYGQNIDFSNCAPHDPTHAYTSTCNDPNGNQECDTPDDPDSQFTYGCEFLTIGITAENGNQPVSITYDFDVPVKITNFEIGDIDYTGSANPSLNSYQDEVDIWADSAGVAVALTSVSGANVDVYGNNTPNLKLLADFANSDSGDVIPDDPAGHANISSVGQVTSITFSYSNGPDDDGPSDDQAIRIEGFNFCPKKEICGNLLDDDTDGYVDSFDDECPAYVSFDCQDRLFQSMATSSGGDYILNEVGTDPVSFTSLSNLSNNGMNASAFNAIAFNPEDGFIYGINPTSGGNYEMYMINPTGIAQYIGNLSGLSGSNDAGCMDRDGNYFVTGASQTLYNINTRTWIATTIANLGFTMNDIAINPENGHIYGWDSTNNRLRVIDPADGSVISSGSVDTQYDEMSAIFFTQSGDLLGYADDTSVSGSTNQETLVDINIGSGIVSPSGVGTATNFADGCSCAYGIGLDKSVSASTAEEGDAIIYTFTIYNNTEAPLTNITFTDQLPAGMSWSSEPYDISGLSFSGSTSVTGNQTATFTISNVPVGSANTFKLSTEVPSGTCDDFSNQASLTNLPLGYNSNVLSDDPSTPEFNDPTTTEVNCSTPEYTLEVECGAVGANWNLVNDATASGGVYATINPPANSYNSFPSGADNHIILDVDVQVAGTYSLYARVRAANGADDSFWFRVNGGGSTYKWNSWAVNASNFTWLQVYNSDNGNTPISINLSAGSNTIDIGYREDGAHIDKIFITQGNITPTGMGDDAFNCPEVCDNGIDDDNDGLIDCEDDDCIGDANCDGPCDLGTLRLTRWLNVSGGDVSSLTSLANYPDAPDEIEYITQFSGPINYADNYGSRVTGYIIPSETGPYTFNVTGDDNIELRLSTNAGAENLNLIASVPGWTSTTDHTKFESQTSVELNLVAGKLYFVELLHKEGTGGDHFQLYWRTPSNNNWTVIPASNLSPDICQEICDNGVDDDGDGLIDCLDPDCGFVEYNLIEFDFEANLPPTLESGVAESENSIYRFSEVDTGIDALVTIESISNVDSIYKLWHAGLSHEIFGAPMNNPHIVYHVDLVNSGTNTLIPPSDFILSGYDLDGYPNPNQLFSDYLLCDDINGLFILSKNTLIEYEVTGTNDYRFSEAIQGNQYIDDPTRQNPDFGVAVAYLQSNSFTITMGVFGTANVPVNREVIIKGTVDNLKYFDDVDCNYVEICGNGEDDDQDGLTDCEDPDCGGSISIDVVASASEICVGESTTLSATIVDAVTYAWESGDPQSPVGSGTVTKTVTPIASTSYTITVTNSAGCTATNQVAVTVNTPPTASLFVNGTITCDNTSVQINSEPSGMSYSWSTGATSKVINVTSAGVYSVTITDSNGCTDTESVTVNEDFTEPVFTGYPDEEICVGESVTLSGSATVGGNPVASYAWMHTESGSSSTTVSPTNTTTYTVVATGTNGCTASEDIIVTVNPLPVASISSSGAITCTNTTVTLTASPAGLSYLWDDGSTAQSRTVSSAGNYSLTVTDGNGCDDIASETVILDNIPPTANAGSNQTICEGESVSLSASGGNTYAWSNGAGNSATVTVSPSSTTSYTVTVTAANGCTDTDNVTVTVNTPPVLICQYEIIGEPLVQGDCTVEVCEGEGLVLSTDPNDQQAYDWSGPNGFSGVGNNLGRITLSTSLTSAHSGDYTVTVTDFNGCTSTNIISVIVNTPPDVVINNDGPITCDDSTVTLTASPSGATYLWSTGETSASIDVTSNSNYSVTVTDGNSCVASGSTTVTTTPPPVANITGPVQICIGEVTTLTPDAGGNWSSSDETIAIISGDGNAVGVSGGRVAFTFTDSSTGCSATSDSITVSPEMDIVIDFIGGICLSDDTQLGVNITGGTPTYSYSWTGPSGFTSSDPIIDVTESGNFYVTVTDAFGCEEATSGYVYERYDPYIFTLSTEICEGESIDLTVNSSSATAYQWSANAGNATTAEVTVMPSPPSTTYTVTITNDLGCTSEADVLIDVIPKTVVSVTGNTTICAGDTTYLTPTTGGVWTSSDFTVATVSADGTVIGVSGGSVSFIFTDEENDCASDPTETITVNEKPVVNISGPTSICVGDVTSLTPSSGGFWISSDTLVAIVDPTTGAVTGIAPGTTTFTFQDGTTGCISDASADITINEVYTPEITGDTNLCVGEETYLTPTSGGTWASSNINVATVSNIGVVTAIGGGTATFTFTSAYDCISPQSEEITVTEYSNMTISGPTDLCEETTSQLTADVPNGTWSSSNNTIVSIDAVTGEITGVAAGTATITYSQDADLCINNAIYNVTVLSKPDANLSGAASLCVGGISQVTTASSGGSWASTDELVAVVSNSGVVVGVAAGQAAFVYTGANGCLSDTTASVTVHPAISVDISFNGGICLEDNTELTADVIGGTPGYNYTWSGPGGFNAITQTIAIPLSGNYTVTVTDNVGCSAEYSAYVYERYEPFIFTLNTDICEGEEVTLSINGSSGGTYQWGVNAGNSTSQSITVTPPVPSATYNVTVTNNIGCSTVASATINVNATPDITLIGNDTICNGGTTAFITSTPGTWISSNYNVATINNNGNVTGINPGTAVFTFRDNATGCYSDESVPVVVRPNTPITIFGDDDICLGTPKLVGVSVAGGTFSSSDNGRAIVDVFSGEITPVSAGLVTINYTMPSDQCYAVGTKDIIVRNLPSVNVNGPNTICAGDVTYLVPTTGGTWASSDESIATVSDIGVVTGIAGGSVDFTFTSSYGCVRALGTSITIIPDPTISVAGDTILCINETTSLSANVPGLWVSSNNTVASISSGGLVTAKSEGTANFTFIEFQNGCQASEQIRITVNGVPDINGLSTPNICIGETATITPNSGGYWISSDLSVATISADGVITGVGAGAASFRFIDGVTGCTSNASNIITVDGKPSITLPPATTLCVGETTNMLPSTGGTWSTSDVSIATISNTGEVTAISSGSVNFTYTNITTGCVSDASADFTIENPVPATIDGPGSLCIDETYLLTSSDLGSWSSSNDAIGSVDNNGLFTAKAPGIVTVTLNTFESCVSNPSYDIQINPDPITVFLGSSAICIGSTTNLSPLTGGTWESSDESVATVTDGGIVTAVAAGNAIFTYTDTVTTCTASTDIALNVFDKPDILIAGDDNICIGGFTSMSPAVGGIWTSTDESIATISISGLVTGISPGDVRFIFTEIGTGCVSDTSDLVTVQPKPIVAVTGDNQLCQFETTMLSPTTGGSWVSDNPSTAIVSDNGVVTALAQGIARFTFVSDAGCASNKTSPVIVFGAPTVLIADSDLCVNESIQISPMTGGTWSSSDEDIAIISDDGIITGLSGGEVRFTFIDGNNGCASEESDVITVNPAPDISLNGSSDICVGSTTQLVPSTGGIWVSLEPSIATIENNGTVTGVSVGNARFTFTQLSTGCTSDTSEYVNVEAGIVPVFLGDSILCIGDTTFISPIAGGTWNSTNNDIATIDNSGMIVAVGQGIAQFQYSESGTNCSSSYSGNLLVNGSPAVSNGGSNTICIGGTTNLNASSAGTWTSSDPSVATVDDLGVVTGISNGDVQLTFTDDATGCKSDGALTVMVQNGTPISLAGPADVCVGYTTNMSPSSGGFWSSTNPEVATITNSGVVTGHASGKVTFIFTDAFTGCTTIAPDDIISVSNCKNHDFNVATVNLEIEGNLSTNDNMQAGSSYSQYYQLVSKPAGSIVDFNVDSDGSYNFSGNKPGNYRYNVPVCGPGQSSGCPTTLLEITILDNIYSEGNPVANIDVATTYSNSDLSLPGLPIKLNLMANDKCVYTGGCNLDYNTISTITEPTHGAAVWDVLGNVTYTSEPGFIGSDTVYYEVCTNGAANCNRSMHIIDVKLNNADNSIIAADDFAFAVSGNTATGNVLSNDSDPENDNITITPQGTELAPVLTDDGSYVIDEEGNYTFTPNDGFSGNTEIIYTICDDNAEVACTDATIHLLIIDDISLRIRLYLEGALMLNDNETSAEGKPLMRDNLRVSPFTGENCIPLDDPYSKAFSLFSTLPSVYSHLGPHSLPENTKIVDSLKVMSITGDNAIVDWVHVELRSKDDMTDAFASRSGLIQRDGDVVDLDGVSPLRFQGVNVDSFYVVIKHRNHLGVMTQKVHYGTFVDLTDNDFPLFDFGTSKGDGYDYTGLAMKENYKNGYRACWAGDIDSNGKIKFAAPYDDQSFIYQDVLFSSAPAYLINFDFAVGYYAGDYDMNSKSKYENPNDDKNHLFGQLLFYPLNTNFISNFDFFIQQVPPAE